MKYYNFGPPLSPFKEHINTALQEADRADLIDLNEQGAAGKIGSQGVDQQKSAESEKLVPGSHQSGDHQDSSKGAVKKFTITVPSGPTMVISKREYEKMENSLMELSARLASQNLSNESNGNRGNESQGHVLSQPTTHASDSMTTQVGNENQPRGTNGNRGNEARKSARGISRQVTSIVA